MNDFDQKLCRFCLEDLSCTTDFIEITSDTSDIFKKVVKIFNFTFSSMQLLPFICLDCKNRLEYVSDFIELVEINQEKIEFLCTDNDQCDLEIEGLPKTEIVVVKEEEQEETEENAINLKVVELVGNFICDLCSNEFHSKRDLYLHMKQHIAHNLNFECHLCKKRLKTERGLKYHVTAVHGDSDKLNEKTLDMRKYLICELCESRPNFETYNDLNMHFKVEHGTRGYIGCCSKHFYTRESILSHIDKHERPIDYMCKICKKFLSSKRLLKDHMLRHKPYSEREYECNFCCKRFLIKFDLTLHIRKVHEKRNKMEQYKCIPCDKEFSSKMTLNVHNNRFHVDLQWLICDGCGKQCRTQHDLKSHMKLIHMDTPKTKCDICGVYLKDMKKHMQYHREKELNITCEICGHQTTTFKYLQLHMKIHNDERPHVCPTCNQAFKRRIALKDHVSGVHNGIPRHACNFCDRAFNNSGNKYKHIKQAHPEEAAAKREAIAKMKRNGMA
uniref:CSON012622 protein n=1 Tax=Culicoides sonorensis TaxID=179676 RepID=A0A336MA35_CULSO